MIGCRLRRCLLHMCHVRLVMSVVLFSVHIATSNSCSVRGDDWHSPGMLRQQYDTSAVVSARTHGSCSVPYSYGFFHQVDSLRTVSTRQNKECLTERIDIQWHPYSAICLIFLETVTSNSSCRMTVYLANVYGSVITCTMVDRKPAVLTF